MIENVRRIQTDRHALGLREFDFLLDGHVGGPGTQPLDCPLTQGASFSRKRCLQHDLAAGIRDPVQRTNARGAQVRIDKGAIEALRIPNLRIQGVAIAIGEHVPRSRTVGPRLYVVFAFERTHDVGSSETVQHATG